MLIVFLSGVWKVCTGWLITKIYVAILLDKEQGEYGTISCGPSLVWTNIEGI